MRTKLVVIILVVISSSITFSQSMTYWTPSSTIPVRFNPSSSARQSYVLYVGDVVSAAEQRTISSGVTEELIWIKVTNQSKRSGWCQATHLRQMKTFSSQNGFSISYFPEWTIEETQFFEETLRSKGKGEFSFVVNSPANNERSFWYFFRDQQRIGISVKTLSLEDYQTFVDSELQAPENNKLVDKETIRIGNTQIIRAVFETIEENPEETLMLFCYKNGFAFLAKVSPYDARMLSGLEAVMATIQFDQPR